MSDELTQLIFELEEMHVHGVEELLGNKAVAKALAALKALDNYFSDDHPCLTVQEVVCRAIKEAQ